MTPTPSTTGATFMEYLHLPWEGITALGAALFALFRIEARGRDHGRRLEQLEADHKELATKDDISVVADRVDRIYELLVRGGTR